MRQAMTYDKLISTLLRAEVALAGVGPDRKQSENQRLIAISRQLLTGLVDEIRAELARDFTGANDNQVRH
jgi:hypothetical protein